MASTKGIVLAGGHGTRLYPTTKIISKQLLPIYNKPMIYYPISTLIMIGIRNILIITTPNDYELFKRLLDDGSRYGCHFQYIIQDEPRGIAHGLILAEKFIGNDRVALILGDNFFYGIEFDDEFHRYFELDGACVFARQVSNPNDYGIIEFDHTKTPISIEEKPTIPKSNYAITGLYFYDQHAVTYAKQLSASQRGELEITDLNRIYLNQRKLRVLTLNDNVVWFDLGTFQSMFDASKFVQTKETSESEIIGSIEYAALKMKFINHKQYEQLCVSYCSTPYGKMLLGAVH